jgi:AcrR family transcriptional regulator
MATLSANGVPNPLSEPSKSGRTRERILEAARALFAEAGFHRTPVRDICARAGVNIASVSYYFHSKESLYETVIGQACQELAKACRDHSSEAPALTEEQKVQRIIERLLESLSSRQSWIARLLFWEIVGAAGANSTFIKAGIDDCFVPLETAVRSLQGGRATLESVRFSALSIISQCVLFTVVSRYSQQMPPPFDQVERAPHTIARHIYDFSLCGLNLKPAENQAA